MLEESVNLRIIQELLGRNSSRTTEIYAHDTTSHFEQIKNPVEDFYLKKIIYKIRQNSLQNTYYEPLT